MPDSRRCDLRPNRSNYSSIMSAGSRPHHATPVGSPPHLENRRQTHYICADCAVSTGPARIPIAAPRNIDENGSLPYKPRQLSAMARLDRGGSFGPETARFGPANIGGLISITGKLAGQRRTTREADLSTQQTGAQAPSRLPRPPCDDRRPQGPRRAPRAWPQTFERLSRASRRPPDGSTKAAGGLPRRCQWRAGQ